MTFETKSGYCRVAWQGLPCYTAVAQLGFKRHATAVLKSNLIRSVELSTAVAQCLKRALFLLESAVNCLKSIKLQRTVPNAKFMAGG